MERKGQPADSKAEAMPASRGPYLLGRAVGQAMKLGDLSTQDAVDLVNLLFNGEVSPQTVQFWLPGYLEWL